MPKWDAEACNKFHLAILHVLGAPVPDMNQVAALMGEGYTAEALRFVTAKEDVDGLRRNGTWGVYQYYIRRAGTYVCLSALGVLMMQAFTAEYASESQDSCSQ